MESSVKQNNSYVPQGLWQFAARPIAFMRPSYTAKSGWLEHVPFAFWLVEAHKPRCIVELGCHYGLSYFAFCQAVQTLELDTRCYAIDTWLGDEHAGRYDESVFRAVDAYNNAHYSGFSRLVRSTFDTALQHFSDGQIDLLHIDGHHSYESVFHDFETWLPKLSERAIVVMHDTNVRERGFGVYRLYEDLAKRYPNFNFLHGHGLGILGVGPERTAEISNLFGLEDNLSGRREFHELFARMGRACADAYWAEQNGSEMLKLSGTVRDQKNTIAEMQQGLAAKDALVLEVRKELESLTLSVGQLANEREALRASCQESSIAQHEAERKYAEAEAKLSLLEGVAQEETRKLMQAEGLANELRLLQEKAVRELEGAETQIAELQLQQQELSRRLAEGVDERFAESATLTEMLRDRDSVIDRAQEFVRLASFEFVRLLELQTFSRVPMIQRWRERRLAQELKSWGLFDADWYLRTYEDVRKAGVDPAIHYVRYGAREGRQPNGTFRDIFQASGFYNLDKDGQQFHNGMV